jgi:hypothetical protein
VKEDGEECLLDVSFRHVKVGRDKMVAVASEAAAARHPWWLQVLRPGIHGAAVVWRALHRKPQADIAGW